MRIGNIKMGIS